MNVMVLGASGGVGMHLMRLATAAGHSVTAVSRSKIDVGAGVTLALGDVSRDGFLDEVMAGHGALLSSLGIRRKSPANPWSALSSPPDFCSATARRIVSAMKRNGLSRVIAVSASGVGDSRPGLNAMMRLFVGYSQVGVAYRDLEAMEAVYRESGLDWCCVRPTGLKDGPVTGRVKECEAFRFNAWISRADVADWMVSHLAADLSRSRTPTITETNP